MTGAKKRGQPITTGVGVSVECVRVSMNGENTMYDLTLACVVRTRVLVMQEALVSTWCAERFDQGKDYREDLDGAGRRHV